MPVLATGFSDATRVRQCRCAEKPALQNGVRSVSGLCPSGVLHSVSSLLGAGRRPPRNRCTRGTCVRTRARLCYSLFKEHAASRGPIGARSAARDVDQQHRAPPSIGHDVALAERTARNFEPETSFTAHEGRQIFCFSDFSRCAPRAFFAQLIRFASAEHRQDPALASVR
jgi:hypothetical protein